MGDARSAWWLKPVNKAMVAAVKIGLMKDGPAVLTVTGRKSGQPRSTPVSPFEVDGQRYVVCGYPGADWVRNVRSNPDVVLTRGRSKQSARMVELTVEQARPLLRQFPLLVPRGADVMKRSGWVSGPNPDEFEALAGRCPVFRFDAA